MAAKTLKVGINGSFSQESLSQESLSTKVAEALSEQILSGQLLPGQRVDLNRFAAKWNVSITPLRDAARHLETLGLVNIMPRRGVFVAELSAKELTDIFNVRIALETAAIRLATPRIPRQQADRALRLYQAARDSASEAERNRLLPKLDMLIHNLGHDYCGNVRLQKLTDGMRDLVKWCQRTIILNLKEPFMTTLPEHIAICEAVCDRDADRAAAAMHDHLSLTLERVQAFLAGQESSQDGVRTDTQRLARASMNVPGGTGSEGLSGRAGHEQALLRRRSSYTKRPRL